MRPNLSPTLDPHQIRAISVVAEASDKTVERYLRGDPVRELSRLRIERAFAKLGLPLPPLLRPPTALHTRTPEAGR